MSDRCSFRKKKSLNNIAFTTIIAKILNLNGNYMYSVSFRKTEEPDQRRGEAKSETSQRQNSGSWDLLQGQGPEEVGGLCANTTLSSEGLLSLPRLRSHLGASPVDCKLLDIMDLIFLNLYISQCLACSRQSIICRCEPT